MVDHAVIDGAAGPRWEAASGVPAPSGPHAPAGPTDRLRRNSWSLIASAALSAASGVGFWLLAARMAPREEVGTAAALVTAVMLIGGLGQIGLRNALIRFLPTVAGPTRGIVLRSYAAAAVATLLFGAVFVVWARTSSPELLWMFRRPEQIAVFLACCVAWALFVLQDSVLTGYRAAHWVPIENLLTSLAKIGLVLVLAGSGAWEISIAWMVPVVAALVPVNLVLIPRMARRRERPAQDGFAARRMMSFAGLDLASDLVRSLGSEVVVLLVLARAGGDASATFFLAATISSTLAVFGSGAASAFVAEVTLRPAEFDALLRRALGHVALVVIPAVAVLVAAAPLVLRVFGPEYVDGTDVLRLVVLGALPQIAITLAVGVARASQRMVSVIVLYLLAALGPLLGAALLLDRFGVEAVGWSTLVVQSLLAMGLLAGPLRPALRRPAGAAPLDPIRAAVQVRTRVREQRNAALVRSALTELDALSGTRWAVGARVVPTGNDVAIAIVDGPEGPLAVRVAGSAAAAAGLARHAAALEDLAERSGRSDVVPALTGRGDVGGCAYVVETAMRGRSPGDGLSERAARSLDEQLVRAVAELHDSTARRVVVDESLVRHLVDEPFAVLHTDRRLRGHDDELRYLHQYLRAALLGTSLHVGRTHGDCWRGNALVEFVDGEPLLTALVDFEDSQAEGYLDGDVLHALLSSEPGDVPGAVLTRVANADDADVLAGLPLARLRDDHLPPRVALLLVWLHHVSNGLRRASDARLSDRWLRQNVVPVFTWAWSTRTPWWRHRVVAQGASSLHTLSAPE